MANTITKSQLARLAFARLREISPNESFSTEDEDTAKLEIDLCKARLESSIFGGRTLWLNDNSIPMHIVEGFLQCVLPSLASHYQAITVPFDFWNTGFQELCRQLARPYNASTLNNEETDQIVVLLDAVDAVGSGVVQQALFPPITLQCWIEGTSGAVTATANFWGSLDDTCLTSQANSAKTLIFSKSLSGTGAGAGISVDSESFVCYSRYPYYWAEVESVSGTGTKVTSKAFFKG